MKSNENVKVCKSDNVVDVQETDDAVVKKITTKINNQLLDDKYKKCLSHQALKVHWKKLPFASFSNGETFLLHLNP